MLKLYIGDKNYSSWSMRPWLVLRKAELPFEEQMIRLCLPQTKEKLLQLSSAGTVPVLQVHDEMIPDSLAISEWAAKCVPNLWPTSAKDRKLAIEFCKTMQEHFGQLRQSAPMNLRRRTRGKLPDAAIADANALAEQWLELLSLHDGPFLFGNWSIADAFSTPYATRFVSYGVPRSARVDTYISELMADEDYLEWEMQGLSEDWSIKHVDAIGS